MKKLKLNYYQTIYLLSGIVYPVWGVLSYYFITYNEPFLERYALGAMFFGFVFIDKYVYEHVPKGLHSFIRQIPVWIVIIHYYTLMERAYLWGSLEFNSYLFGSLVVLFCTGYISRKNTEIFLWCVISISTSLFIARNVEFMSKLIFCSFVLTMIVFVGLSGFYANYLEMKLKKEQKRTFENQKLVALGEIAGGLSHEINNSLMVIFASVEVLKLKKVYDDNIITSIEGMIGHLDSVMKTINKFSDSNKGLYKEEQPKEFNVIEELTDILKIFKRRSSEENIKLIFDESQKVPNIVFPRDEFGQVILNLMNNAIYEALRHKNPFICFGCSYDENFVYLEIGNSGEAFTREDHERIFEPFYSTKPVNEGSGLGLSVSKKVLNSHNGNIVISSFKDYPSFTLTLPRKG